MYFVREDELSIHTFVAASFRVLRDVTKNRGTNYSEEIFRAGVYNIAKQYGGRILSEDALRAIRNSGLLPLIEAIASDIREQGDKFDRSRIEITNPTRVEQKTWPSAPSNFLKHADRDADALLSASDINNEVFLMGACEAYIQLMRTPSPACFCEW